MGESRFESQPIASSKLQELCGFPAVTAAKLERERKEKMSTITVDRILLHIPPNCAHFEYLEIDGDDESGEAWCFHPQSDALSCGEYDALKIEDNERGFVLIAMAVGACVWRKEAERLKAPTVIQRDEALHAAEQAAAWQRAFESVATHA